MKNRLSYDSESENPENPSRCLMKMILNILDEVYHIPLFSKLSLAK